MISEFMKDVYIHNTAIVDEGCEVGEGTRIWHFSHLNKGCRIGKNCSFGQNVYVASTAVVGNGVKVQNNVSIYDGVVLEDDVFIGPSAVFTNVINPRSFVVRKSEYKQTIVKQGASLGANSTVVCGCIVGAYAMIGAGAVVTKDVKNYALMVGVPAEQIGWVSRVGCRLDLNGEGEAVCPESGEKYKLENGELFKI